jgi:DNA-binding response OmpR family regulator
MDDYLSKPIQPVELVAAIRSISLERVGTAGGRAIR